MTAIYFQDNTIQSTKSYVFEGKEEVFFFFIAENIIFFFYISIDLLDIFMVE